MLNLCTFADVARSKDIRNIFLLHDELSKLLDHYCKSGKLKLSLNVHVHMHKLYCLEDVFIAAEFALR